MSDWKKIIFTDIDGTVNSSEWYERTRGRLGNFDPEKISLLNQLKDIGAEVVVSSSWGKDGEEQLKNVGLELPIIGCTEHFHVDWFCRGNEIEKWINANLNGASTKYGCDENGVPYYRKLYSKEDIDFEYVILDDDADMLLGQKDNFIHVSNRTGLTQADIDKARKILTRDGND